MASNILLTKKGALYFLPISFSPENVSITLISSKSSLKTSNTFSNLSFARIKDSVFLFSFFVASTFTYSNSLFIARATLPGIVHGVVVQASTKVFGSSSSSNFTVIEISVRSL